MSVPVRHMCKVCSLHFRHIYRHMYCIQNWAKLYLHRSNTIEHMFRFSDVNYLLYPRGTRIEHKNNLKSILGSIFETEKRTTDMLLNGTHKSKYRFVFRYKLFLFHVIYVHKSCINQHCGCAAHRRTTQKLMELRFDVRKKRQREREKLHAHAQLLLELRFPND